MLCDHLNDQQLHLQDRLVHGLSEVTVLLEPGACVSSLAKLMECFYTGAGLQMYSGLLADCLHQGSVILPPDKRLLGCWR